MAESAVKILLMSIEFMLDNSGYVIGGVRHEISKVKLELESIGSFIKDAEKCKNQNEGVSVWVVQVRDVAFEAEDIIDEFSYHVGSMKKKGFAGRLAGVFYLPKELWLRYKTALDLKRIRGEIKDIAKRSKRYDLSHMEASSSVGSDSHQSSNCVPNIGESSLFIENDQVVGIDQVKDSLLSSLEGEETHRIVISVVGMGGSGKTTLVAKAYTSLTVRKNFDCCAWVSVAQNKTTEDLLKKLISEFFEGEEDLIPKNLNSMDYRQLVETLVKFLHKKRYVVVFDDIWNNNFWRQISVALPDDKNRSRIIITTRNEDIAAYPYGPGTHVFRSKPLTDDYAWMLFCNKAFLSQPNCQCPPELEKIGRALVKTCEGLPLAIVALGGLMGSKDRSELKWREVYDSLSWHISNNKLLDEVKTVMLMSFDDLPYYLKNCFLYCCRFPMGEWIGAGRLIRMWMAEGFLEEKSSLNPEEVGKIYLKELISRNLFQVVKHQSFIRPKLCKLHDLMWELARSISERENFLSICSQEELEKEEIRARRLSVHNVDGTVKMSGDLSHIRSFSMFNFKGESKFLLDDLLPRFRLLRVLELDDANVDSLPNEVGKLFNLRYLSLSGTGIKELPTSVNRLRNLQTLDIRRTEVSVLPDGITELHNLRHLLAYGKEIGAEHFAYGRGVQVPSKLWKLKNLQVLNCIEANEDIARKIRKMTKLRRIELTNVKEEYMKNLCSSIDKFKFLHHLLVMTVDANAILKLDDLSETPFILRKVTLVGKMCKVPRWFSSMLNVMHLHLHWSQFPEDQDPIPCISQLPSLEHLVLVNTCTSKKQLLFESGFQKLEDLHISCLSELEEIVFLEGVMPKLASLHIHNCPKLKEVPQGLEYLTNLEQMNLKAASSELRISVAKEVAFIQTLDGSHPSNITMRRRVFMCMQGCPNTLCSNRLAQNVATSLQHL